jgi:hypothetical protein
MGFHVIRDGERVAVWSLGGNVEFVDGPRLLFTVMKRVELLRSFRANQYQYLRVLFRDGRLENIPGPILMFFDPLEHSQITVEDAQSLAAHEVLVIYSRNLYHESPNYADPHFQQSTDAMPVMVKPASTTNVLPTNSSVTRTIIHGPKIHFPSNFEWIHKFEWHGEDPNRKAHIIPRAQVFEKLKLIPISFYYNVTDVRTADDALVSVKIMIFYEITDLEKMLDMTMDPIADMVNAACSDIVSFVAARNYATFVDSIPHLSDLETYKQLNERTPSIGITVTRVVYRGYLSNENLQKMHNQAIERRTELRLNGEAEATSQEIENLKLKGQAERMHAKMQMEEEEKRHRNAMLNLDHEQNLYRIKKEQEEKLAALAAENEEKLRYYQSLSSLGVDLTKVLVAPFSTPTNTIRIEQDGNGSGQPAAQLHIHEKWNTTKLNK